MGIIEKIYAFLEENMTVIDIHGRLANTALGVHVLYGVVSVMVLTGIYLYTRGDDNRRALLVYTAGFLFLAGILFRVMMTTG